MHLPLQLVVLSACETAGGRQAGMEGIIGLDRAFMIAGARRVMMSLWPVDDESSSLFMDEFYRAMFGSAHLDPAEALRLARIALWRNPTWSDPKYWSAFVLDGDWTPIAIRGASL